MQGNEWKVRKLLYDLATLRGEGWVLWLDADQILSSNPRPHLSGDSCAFKVFDMWSETHYREDAWWRGHIQNWWWGVNADKMADFEAEWPERGWHSGHVPRNLPDHARNPTQMPIECSILHYAYTTEELRAKKVALYKALEPSLTQREIGHARTIPMKCHTKPLPLTPEYAVDLG